jgi:DNA-binding transcriptional LysR family regulator
MDSADLLRLEADVSIQLVRPSNPDLVTRKLGCMHIYPFASRDYIATNGAPGNPLELFQHRIVDQTSPQLPDGVLQGYLGAIDLEGVVSVRTNASTAHFYAVELGIGIGGLPTYAVPLGADLVPLDIGLQHKLDLWLAYNPAVRRIPRVTTFIDWLVEQFNPSRFPWFRDEFIHPNEFEGWVAPPEDLRFAATDRVKTDPASQ